MLALKDEEYAKPWVRVRLLERLTLLFDLYYYDRHL